MLNENTLSMVSIADGGQIANYDPDGLSEHWLNYFDPQKALDDVVAHVASLRGQRRKSKHTERAYRDGLAYALRWLGADVERDLVLSPGWFSMPGRSAVKRLIAHLYVERELAASTINAKYLTPLRHWLKALDAQTPMPGNAGDMMLIGMLKDELRQAVAVPGPAAEETSNIAPLWREGTRLTLEQVNQVLRAIDRTRLDGMRDYALLMVAFYTALRRAELAQITLNSIKREGDVWLVYTIGKRSNVDPVALPAQAYEALMAWVKAYNDELAADDPRRIEGDVSVWQALRRGGHRRQAGETNVKRGMREGSLHDVIKRRVEGVLDVQFAAHDTRRTAAAIAYRQGMLINQIQKVLRHKDAAVTLAYVGEPPEWSETDLGKVFAIG